MIVSVEQLDDIDRRMIDILRREARISIPALAERVGLGRATAYTRFDRLVDRGVIRGFRADVDPKALGLEVAALVLVNVEQRNWRAIQPTLAALDSVEWVGLASGAFDIVLRVRCANLDALRDVVLVQLHAVDGVTSAQTVVLLDETPVEGSVALGSG